MPLKPSKKQVADLLRKCNVRFPPQEVMVKTREFVNGKWHDVGAGTHAGDQVIELVGHDKISLCEKLEALLVVLRATHDDMKGGTVVLLRQRSW